MKKTKKSFTKKKVFSAAKKPVAKTQPTSTTSEAATETSTSGRPSTPLVTKPESEKSTPLSESNTSAQPSSPLVTPIHDKSIPSTESTTQAQSSTPLVTPIPAKSSASSEPSTLAQPTSPLVTPIPAKSSASSETSSSTQLSSPLVTPIPEKPASAAAATDKEASKEASPSDDTSLPLVERVHRLHLDVLLSRLSPLLSRFRGKNTDSSFTARLFKNRTVLLFLVISFALITAVSVSLKLYLDASRKLAKLNAAAVSGAYPTPSEKELRDLLNKVGRLMILPTGTPRVVTVTNIETLKKEQPFFENAKDGNELLVFANKVIIYDPVADRIVDIAYIKPSSATESATSAVQQVARVVLYNGTARGGLTTTAENNLKDKLPGMEIVGREKAKKSDYTETIVSDYTGKNTKAAQDLATLLGAKVADFPKDEATPPASLMPVDMVVILGSSYK